MAFVLRAIENKVWWVQSQELLRAQPSLSALDLQADAYRGVRTTTNALSVFAIPDDSASLARVAAALISTKDNLPQFDYAVVTEPDFRALGLKTQEALGTTPDAGVNAWHLNILELNSERLTRFCRLLQRGRIGRKLPRELALEVKRGIDAEVIDSSKLHPRFLESVERYLRPPTTAG